MEYLVHLHNKIQLVLIVNIMDIIIKIFHVYLTVKEVFLIVVVLFKHLISKIKIMIHLFI